jgi:hypothetical protein|uniref:Zinc-ribbon domain-containing protein n=1 Tax=viral metagenome TaxID=1070528 RepID=A0A6C0JQ06_9ZZZZ
MDKIEELKEYVIDKNLGECLSSEWINCKTKYKWECQKGHVFEKIWGAIKYRGEWCKQCTKVGISTCRDLASKNNGELLSDIYNDNRTKLKWKCKNNHIFQSAWRHINKRPNFCPKCPRKKKNIEKPVTKRIKLSIENCQEEAKKFGGKCLDLEYKNRRTLMKWQCGNNHTFTLTLGAVRNNGRWCRECNYDKQRHDISVAQDIAKKYGGECLSTDYVNLETPMKWRCKEGHEWEVNMINIKGSGSWCRMCHLRTRRDKAIKRIFKWVSILGGKLLTKNEDVPYDIGADQFTLNIKCNKDHTFTRTFKSLRTGSWCPKCTYKSESACRDVLESVYPYTFPKRRLKCMEYLELDGYCEELGIAFEYDGKQHAEYIPHFHRNGMNDLLDQMTRDDRTNDLCKKNGISLIRIPHTYSYINLDELSSFIYSVLENLGF